MTLMNGLVDGKRAHLWTDTLWMDAETGKPIGHGPKAMTFLFFPAAMAVTTVGGNPTQISDYMASRPCLLLGSLLEKAEEAARAFVASGPSFATVRMLVAGWCEETETPRLFLITSDGASSTLPFVAQEVAWSIGSAFTVPAVQEHIAAGLNVERMEEIAELQRANPECPDLGGFKPMLGIGGELIRLTVSRAGVETVTVKAWDVAEGATLAAA